MQILNEYLNVRNSTRKLTDSEFEKILPTLAEELVSVNYRIKYSEEKLRADWKKLLDYDTSSPDRFTASTVRVGMKLCEHFFPNFYSIQNKNNESFESLWVKENLEKILRWNRKSHSTPYLSELKRGIYFCCGLTKNTMFRPHLAKMICDKYKFERVFDPCAGWGGRMLGVCASGAEYIGFEPNPETYRHLLELKEYLNLNARIINDKAENFTSYDILNADGVLTSPPYYNLEIYSTSGCETKYDTYETWLTEWLTPLIMDITDAFHNVFSCWNVHNIGKMKLQDDIIHIHEVLGYKKIDEFGIVSSKRQTNNQKQKNTDSTIIFT